METNIKPNLQHLLILLNKEYDGLNDNIKKQLSLLNFCLRSKICMIPCGMEENSAVYEIYELDRALREGIKSATYNKIDVKIVERYSIYEDVLYVIGSSGLVERKNNKRRDIMDGLLKED